MDVHTYATSRYIFSHTPLFTPCLFANWHTSWQMYCVCTLFSNPTKHAKRARGCLPLLLLLLARYPSGTLSVYVQPLGLVVVQICTPARIHTSHAFLMCMCLLVHARAVLPSGTSLPFGAMIAKMKRNKMMEDIMEVGGKALMKGKGGRRGVHDGGHLGG